MYCSPFDKALATHGPAAIFLHDPEGDLRFDPRWTRDCWGRAPGPHTLEPTWLLLRDTGSGWVTRVFCNSSTLLTEHPRLQIRVYTSDALITAAHQAIGHPPVAADPW